MAGNEEKKEKSEVEIGREGEIERLKKIINTIRKISLWSMPAVPVLYLVFYILLDVPRPWRIPRFFLVFLPVIVWYLTYAFKVVYDWERLVIFRLGKFQRTKKPGIALLLKPIERQIFVKMWEKRADLKPQTVLVVEKVPTEEGEEKEVLIDVKLNAIFYYKVDTRDVKEIEKQKNERLEKELRRKGKLDEYSPISLDKFYDPAYRSLTKIEDVDGAIQQLVETYLRAISARYGLEEIVSKRRKFSEELRKIVEKEAEDWGIVITRGELQYVDPPKDILEAMRGIFISDRERTAAIINALARKKVIAIEYAETYKQDPHLILRSLEAGENMAQGPASTIFLDRRGPSLIQDFAAAAETAKKIDTGKEKSS